jgi:hypothetical protein
MSQPQQLQRLPDWPERLAAYLQQHRHVAFAWGQADCVRFAAGAVQAITGCDVLPCSWADKAGALRQLRLAGGLQAAVAGLLPALGSPAWAQRGDVLLVQASAPAGRMRRRWLAVADGHQWRAPDASGLRAGPMAMAVMAWGVGHA